jgi:hypothetical protein
MLTYVLPIRSSRPADEELFAYLAWLAPRVQLIVVDGSDAEVFREHARGIGPAVEHCAPDSDLRDCLNGKVAGVITGLRRASNRLVVIADDDVRYDEHSLIRVATALRDADVVRPQNYFDPIPWHAYIDTARTLLNRVSGGDWPGTLAIRRDTLGPRGYDGDVLFENLELMRTVIANGGSASCPLDLFVRRLPPSTKHFWSQRVRQAYDEFARPPRLILWLSIAPLILLLFARRRLGVVAAGVVAAMLLAEAGRRRAHGRTVFPAVASLCAPLWVVERAVCAWFAVGAFLLRGGISYRGGVIRRAATPLRVLRASARAHSNRSASIGSSLAARRAG